MLQFFDVVQTLSSPMDLMNAAQIIKGLTKPTFLLTMKAQLTASQILEELSSQQLHLSGTKCVLVSHLLEAALAIFYAADYILGAKRSNLVTESWDLLNKNLTQVELTEYYTLTALHNIETTMLKYINVRQPLLVLKGTNVGQIIYRHSSSSSSLGSYSIQHPASVNVTFPAVSLVQEEPQGKLGIQFRMLVFPFNPLFTTAHHDINGTVASIKLTRGKEELKVKGVSRDIEIFLSRHVYQDPTVRLSTSRNVLTVSVNVTAPIITLVVCIEPDIPVNMTMYLGFGVRPLEGVILESATFPKPGLTGELAYTWVLEPLSLSKGEGVYFITAVTQKPSTAPQSTQPSKNVTYSVTTFSTQCLFWNTSLGKWSAEGCKVGPRSTLKSTQCLCTHLTFFTTSFFVQPNTLDLRDTVKLFADVSNNPVVVALVKVTILRDNNPFARYNYLVQVFTGHRFHASTSAQVVLTLIGSEGESEPHHLTDPEKPVFERGGVDMFLLTTPFSLGELQGIRLWHHNTGDSPAWYVNKVSVYDLEAQRKWPFLCNCWLAADIDGATLDRVFPPATESQLTMFRYLFMWRTTQSFVDGHLWMSVLTRPIRSRFTRAQRVSCCFSLLLCTMLCNIMYWNITSGPDSLTIDLGIYSFSWADVMVGVQSALMMFPVNLLIVQLFRLSKPRPPRGTEQSHFGWVVLPTANFYTGLGIRTEKLPSPSPVPPRGCELPWWFVYLGWLCVFLTSGLAAFFTMMYGLKMGRVQSTQWLVAMAVTLFQSIFILQPLKVLTMALFLSLILKKRDPDGEDNEPLKICVTDPGDTVWFCQDRSDPLYQPPTPQLTQSARDLREQKRSLYLLLRDILAHLLFLSLLMVIAYAARNPNQFYLYRAVHSSTSTNLEWVREIQDFYPWANTTLLPNLYGEYRGFISDGHSWLLGSPRLLQVRVRDRPCPVISKTRQQCHPSYTSTDEDTANYGPGWTNSTTGGQSGLGQAWQYHTAASLQKNPVWGRLALYQGGGYAVELGTEREQAYRVLSLLSKEGWLDQRSRALLVEFNVFNANVNLFCVVTLALETSGMGGVYSSLLLHSMSLYLSMGSISLLVMAAHILYLIFVIYYMVMQGLLMKEQRLAYFRSLLNLVDMSIILMSWTGMGLYISTLVLGDRLISEYQGDRTRFVSFEQVVLVDSIYNYLIAFLVCLATVKLWHLLHLNPKLYLISSAIRRAWGELRLFLLIIVILIISYSITCNLLFGWSLSSYSTVSRSAITILCLLMGYFNYNEVLAVDHILAVVVIGSCIIFVVFIAVNLFVSVLLVSFQKEIKNPTPCEDAFVMEILLRKLGSLLGFNPQGSKKNTEPAETEKNTKKKGARRPVAAFVQQWPCVKLDSGAPIFYSYQ
ncbi:UNVERIFIED_CONTAM: hypothetical protein FKN15_022898 [Acipenser sinensis]